MRTAIVSGEGFVDVELPDHTREARLGPTLPLAPVADLEEEVARALREPVDAPPLRAAARGARAVTIAFDDPTVPCYAPLWEVAIERVLGELAAAGVARGQVRLLCANALHRKFTGAELGKLLGPALASEFAGRLGCHDAEDPDRIVSLGETAAGHPVELDRCVVDSDLVVYVNASCYRGFNGGWKSICVGLSTWRSIRVHHTPERMTMSLERNPMHAILDEMGALAQDRLGRGRFYKLETLLADPLQVARVFAGSVDGTRRAALALLRAHLADRRAALAEPADVVVYGVPAWSPYAAFARMNPLLTLLSTGLGYLGGAIPALGRPGCTVVMATPCVDDWDDAHHPSYREVWERALPEAAADPLAALERLAPELAARAEYLARYRDGFGFHPVHPLLGLFPLTRLRHAGRVIVAGPGDPALARHAGLDAAPSVQEAVARALAHHGPGASLALVRYPPAPNRC